jgi:hypothetical protein
MLSSEVRYQARLSARRPTRIFRLERGLVSGHGFSRAAGRTPRLGFSRCLSAFSLKSKSQAHRAQYSEIANAFQPILH